MSKITLEPNDSGAGTFSIVSPDSNINRTLTLPDESGSVLTDVSDIEPQVKTATNATGDAPIYACRAWVNFDGTDTVSIRESGNVSSITDQSTGIYRINLTNDMPDSNYSVVATAGFQQRSTATIGRAFSTLPQTNSFQVRLRNVETNSDVDLEFVCVSVFR